VEAPCVSFIYKGKKGPRQVVTVALHATHIIKKARKSRKEGVVVGEVKGGEEEVVGESAAFFFRSFLVLPSLLLAPPARFKTSSMSS